jgi:hypothetical protein
MMNVFKATTLVFATAEILFNAAPAHSANCQSIGCPTAGTTLSIGQGEVQVGQPGVTKFWDITVINKDNFHGDLRSDGGGRINNHAASGEHTPYIITIVGVKKTFCYQVGEREDCDIPARTLNFNDLEHVFIQT